MIFSPETAKTLDDQLAIEQAGVKLDARTFASFFGTAPDVMSECWERIGHKVEGGKPKHLLWTFMFMKLCLPEDVMCVLLATSKPTMKKWVWKFMESLALESLHIVDRNKHKRNLPRDALSSITVDGTDFKTQEPHPFNRKWMSHKHNGAGLKCEVAMSVFSGNIVWVCGPHRGSKHDLTTFREKIKGVLEQGEMAEGDKGCAGEPDTVRAKDDHRSKAERKEKDGFRARHEACNRRFKCWSILKQEHRHDNTKHECVFRAVVAVTQLAVDNGSCLFGCEPIMAMITTGRHSLDNFDLNA